MNEAQREARLKAVLQVAENPPVDDDLDLPELEYAKTFLAMFDKAMEFMHLGPPWQTEQPKEFTDSVVFIPAGSDTRVDPRLHLARQTAAHLFKIMAWQQWHQMSLVYAGKDAATAEVVIAIFQYSDQAGSWAREHYHDRYYIATVTRQEVSQA